ncbi:S8 family serine peptidase [Saccharothrix sp. NRRL B-16348]|uniref:S8 family serine peptidase n=1 Tax=Saccharothrix sp. NRRL B-16348 TaxID=1415542 RepID=UPI000A8A0811|nr:S8 family serine peptidase [Saccharothrix sp. NRRL B-16348]
MRRLMGKVPFAAVLLAAVLPSASANAEAPTSGYIVLLADGVDVSTMAAQHGDAVGHLYRSAVRGYSTHMSTADAERLARDPRVVLVQPDGVVSIAAQTMPTGIDRVDAELSPTAAIDGVDTRVDVDVAVLDTGVDLDHPDLNVHLAGARNCSFGRTANDGHGHGSHVAGTIGALDDDAGVVVSRRAPASGR